MSKFIDLTGQRFGRLVAIKRVPKPNHLKGNSTWWLCQCDCGNTKEFRAGSITNGETKSCGCINKKSIGESVFNDIVGSYRRHAKKKGIPFELTNDYFECLTKEKCFYCGEIPSRTKKSKYNNGDYIYNGIDRIDNSLGYVDGNVVSCCTTCNLAKRAMSMNEFTSWINKVYNNLILKE